MAKLLRTTVYNSVNRLDVLKIAIQFSGQLWCLYVTAMAGTELGAFGVRRRAILCRVLLSAECALIVFACRTVADAAAAGPAAESVDKPIATRYLASRQPHYKLATVQPLVVCPRERHCSCVVFVSREFSSQTLHRVLQFWATVRKTVRPLLSDPCMSCLSVTLVYCGKTVGWIKMKLGMQVGLDPGHIVLDGDPAPPPQKRGHSPQFSAHVYCGQTAGWIKISLGTEVGLDPGDIVLDGDSALPSILAKC